MRKTIFLFGLLLILLAAGCGTQNNGSSTDKLALTQTFVSAVETGIVESIEAVMQSTPSTPTPEGGESTQLVLPTITNTLPPQATLAPTQPASAFTPTPTPLPTPCYLAVLVSETIPDGTVIHVGDGFTKTWVVMNAGVCAWSENFRWKLVEGDDFRGDTDLKISKEDVMPGDTITISIEMGAPLIPGHYRSVYKIFTDEGAEITPNGFWIDVTVVNK